MMRIMCDFITAYILNTYVIVSVTTDQDVGTRTNRCPAKEQEI